MLILENKISSSLRLFPVREAIAEEMVRSMSSRMTAFGAFEWLFSAQGSYLKNCVVEVVTDLKASHHFLTNHLPWANVNVEWVCREAIRPCRDLLTELRLVLQDELAVIEIVKSVIKH